MIKQFFNFDIDARAQVVKEGDTLNTGRHTLTFVMAPMVHWPEVMVTYDVTDKILFSLMVRKLKLRKFKKLYQEDNIRSKEYYR